MPAAPRFLLALVVVLVFGSGCAALVYEIVWFQMLQLVLGSSAVSLGVLVGTYMGGMCLGSLALPRIIPASRHPFRVFAVLETGIALLGMLILFGLPDAVRVYSMHSGSGLAGILLRGLFASICLLPPTVLMGATLPAIARRVQCTHQGVSWMGFFYCSNLAGAVFGCLLAGFYLIRVHDLLFASCTAAVVNVTVALAASGLSFATQSETGPKTQSIPEALNDIPDAQAGGKEVPWLVYVTIALSGLTAIGAEVIWTRLLSMLMASTVYAFSIILAMFLLGLGIGSGLASTLTGKNARNGAWLGWSQFLLTGAILWTAFKITRDMPFHLFMSPSPWVTFLNDMDRCFWALLPPTLMWGASFPLALAAARRQQDPARLVGGVYAANTIGAIIGSIAFSIIFIPWLGTQESQRLLILLSGIAALLMLVSVARQSTNFGAGWKVAAFATVALGTFLFGANVPKVPDEMIAYGGNMPLFYGKSKVLYVGEGMNSSIAVTQTLANKVLNFHVTGRIEASTERTDMRLQRMLGQLPSLVHGHPSSVLIVGCGAGVTSGSFVIQPGIEKITICELEPLIPKVVDKFFAEQNFRVMDDPRTHLVFDDARHYILTTNEKYDIITSDPIHPRVKGAAALYTKEYFEMEKNHLNPGGLVTQWVPLYESNLASVKSEIATFFDVFPHGTIWGNLADGKGYDLVMLGQAGETKIDLDEMTQRLRDPAYTAVAQSLQDLGYSSVADFFATYSGSARDLAPWLADAAINTDRNLCLQYMAGLVRPAEAAHSAEDAFADIVAYRKSTDAVFMGSSSSLQSLQEAMARLSQK